MRLVSGIVILLEIGQVKSLGRLYFTQNSAAGPRKKRYFLILKKDDVDQRWSESHYSKTSTSIQEKRKSGKRIRGPWFFFSKLMVRVFWEDFVRVGKNADSLYGIGGQLTPKWLFSPVSVMCYLFWLAIGHQSMEFLLVCGFVSLAIEKTCRRSGHQRMEDFQAFEEFLEST